MRIPSLIEVRGNTLPYVSRGGLKLEKAMNRFGLDLKDKVCMDVGASTGGFTDCMLQNGAAKVYAVDVGHGQLAWKLRKTAGGVHGKDQHPLCDPRTVAGAHSLCVHRRILHLPDQGAGPGEGASGREAEIVCLIKPQFEAGREKVGKKGVVREKGVHREVIEMVMGLALSAGGFMS